MMFFQQGEEDAKENVRAVERAAHGCIRTCRLWWSPTARGN
jgi:hypothetical protein